MMHASDALVENQPRTSIRPGRYRSHYRRVFLKRVVDSVCVIIRKELKQVSRLMRIAIMGPDL
jgi:hypothetical protein